jgi:prophage regulatory protein
MTNHLDLPATGFLRLASVLAPRFPKPVKLGLRITAWRVEDIRALIEQAPGA